MGHKSRLFPIIPAVLFVLLIQSGPAAAEEIGRIPAITVQALGPASVNSLLGKKVTNPQGENLGFVGGILLFKDRIGYVILHLAEPGGAVRQIPIPASMAELRMAEDLVLVQLEKSRLVQAPNYTDDGRLQFLDLEWEQRIHSYYGGAPPEKAMDSYILIQR